MAQMTFACPEAYEALRGAIVAGLQIVREHEVSGRHISTHSEFPEMSTFDSGLPRFTKTFWGSKNAPLDYRSIFRDERSAEKIPEWAPFFGLAKSNTTLWRYFDESPNYRMEVDGAAASLERLRIVTVGLTIEQLLDRYIHLTKTKEFNEDAFAALYQEWEKAVFAEYLFFDILVPLLMVTSDIDMLDVADGVRIEQMPEPLQLARSDENRYLVSANECVVGAATHALVLQQWYIKNTSRCLRRSQLNNVESFHDAIERIDLFFAALRAVTGVQTGYCQLLIRPVGWCDGSWAHLPQIGVIPLRAYPDHFEHFGWLRKPPSLDDVAFTNVGQLYTALTSLKKNQLLVASRRLNLAQLRSSEQDSIIDVAIGLETLLVEDGATGEITHKLAMRLAALCRMQPFDGYTPSEVFGLCKKLYEFRSAVAHGSQSMDKKRIITIADSTEPIQTVVLGANLLRHAIRFLAGKPEFLSSRTLDMTLFDEETPRLPSTCNS